MQDVEGVCRQQKDRLDYAYLDPRIKELADLLEKPGIFTNWEKVKKGS